MPRVSSLPRFSRNLYAYGRAALAFRRAKPFREALAEAASKADVVHFNHEGLFLLAHWLNKNADTALTMHIRTMLHDSLFARWQSRVIARSTAACVFITENEQRNMAALGGAPRAQDVIHNIVPPVDSTIEAHPEIATEGRPKVACLGNYAWVRGIDRLIDVAAVMAADGRRDILFVVAGDMRVRERSAPTLREIARRGGSLVDYAEARGVADMFAFLGHVAEPERVLAGCDILVRPSRENNPWGRDVLEAMAAGLPVVTLGSYDRFVEDGVTGVLHPDYQPARMARALLNLANDTARRKQLGEAARTRVSALCDGRARAADLLDVWRKAA
jgi:glycosyltransferase involved in cell wall biosynthesis